MQPRLSTIFASPFVDLSGLKQTLLYFDHVKLPSNLSFFEPTIKGEFITRAEALAFVTPETVQKELSLLVTEGIIDIVDLNLVGSRRIVKPGEDNEYYLDPTAKFVQFHSIKTIRREVRRVLERIPPGSYELQYLSNGQSDSLLICDNKTARLATSHFYSQMYWTVDHMTKQYRLPVSTDSEVFTKILYKPYSDRKFLKRVHDIDLSLSEHQALLARKVLDIYIPNLADVPIADVLEVRRKLHDELERFKTEIWTLSSEMSSAELSEDALKEADRIVRTKVVPSVRDLKNKLEASSDKILLKAFKNIRSPKSYVPLLGTVFGDFSIVAAGLASFGVAALGAVIEEYVDRRKAHRHNRFSFLIRAPRVFKHVKPAGIKQHSLRLLLHHENGDALIGYPYDGGYNFLQAEEALELLDQVRSDPERALRFLQSQTAEVRETKALRE